MKWLQRQFRRTTFVRVIVLALLLMLSVIVFFVMVDNAERSARKLISENASETLKIQSDAILTQFEKYRYLPALVAERSIVSNYFKDGQSVEARTALSALLIRMAALSGALDITLADHNGKVLLGANSIVTTQMIKDTELVFAPRQSRLGRLSITSFSKNNAYAFSSNVFVDDVYKGFIVVTASLNATEEAWALSVKPIFAADAQGNLVAGNSLARSAIFGKLPLTAEQIKSSDFIINSKHGTHRLYSKSIPILDWTLFVMEPESAVEAQKNSAGIISILGSALGSLLLFGFMSRTQLRIKRERVDKANAIRLERKIRDRTKDLVDINSRLEAEVHDRRQAQAALMVAQQDLIQAEKLAAIGQISATLAHEYNQPLSAVRSYSENALRYLEREQPKSVHENLDRISSLVERMATLSKSLLAFARKPDENVGTVDLRDALKDAMLLVKHQAKEFQVNIETSKTNKKLMVMADQLRLSQVIVNLLSNAIDACRDKEVRNIHISWIDEGDFYKVEFLDSGTGIKKENLSKIFEPFFTSKKVGSGLGLGLSIAYNCVRDFGGSLEVKNKVGAGALFTLKLRKANMSKKNKDGSL